MRPLLARLARVSKWLDEASRGRYALVHGLVFSAVTAATYSLVTDYPLRSALLLGAVSGLCYGGFQYVLDPQ